MKTEKHYMGRLAVLLLSAIPLFASAAATDAGTDYTTDKTNSYVHDQTSKAMEQLNSILCSVAALAPAEMVNLGDYIALVDNNICDPNSGGGQSGSTNSGANYEPIVVNSTRTDNASPMIVKAWIDQPRNNSTIRAYVSATQAPSLPEDPFGRFRLDYVESNGGTPSGQGFINSTASGLDFFQYWSGNGGGGPETQTLRLKLNVTSSTAGSGSLSMVHTGGGGGGSATFDFGYDANHFRRADGTNDVCFSRDPLDAVDSVWSYGLYNSTTGARIQRNSGFPIEYEDATNGTMNGHISYWGLNSPTTIASGTTVNQVTYVNGGPPVKTPYTLMTTGGKLIKYTKATSSLAALDKVKFQFWPQVSTANFPTGAGIGGYEAYWDETGQTFVRSGHQDQSTYNIVPDTPVNVGIAEMKTAMPWGLYGWSNMLGGNFGIDMTAMATLSSATQVVTHVQDVVYPSEFAALGGMECINNCPTAADISASNAAPSGSPVSPYLASSINWGESNLYSYTLDATSGNLVDAAPAAVTSSATTGNNAWGVNSGRLVATADLTALNVARDARIAANPGFTAGMYVQSDIEALPTYYEWQTGANNWNQLAYLVDGLGAPVVFDPPLNVTYSVPNNATLYGISAGATITLQYGGFGNLWGIPSTCIDISTNSPCDLVNGSPTQTAQNLQRWTPEFSIPSDGTVAEGATTYLVKALNKEVRLGKVNCNTTALAAPTAAASLPTVNDWQDPTNLVGAAPTFTVKPAPQVIHGEKMY